MAEMSSLADMAVLLEAMAPTRTAARTRMAQIMDSLFVAQEPVQPMRIKLTDP